MNGDVVCDASVLVSLLTNGAPGRRIAEAVDGVTIHAPHLALFEIGNALRGMEFRSELSSREAAEAFGSVADLPVDLWAFPPLAERAWGLRANLTIYDAAYVALAEHVEATLVTLDRRLAGAPGLRCDVVVP